MSGETTVPLLPCPSIDEVGEFYRMLGFEQTYRQTRPNPYVVMAREDIQLHFFGMDDFDPERSYGSCLVFVPDTGVLFDSFAAGMRDEHGKLLLSGIPRMTRPRKRANTGNRAGFSVVDPGGNVIRFFPQAEDENALVKPHSRLGRTLVKAIVLGDSKGDAPQAARILDSTLAKADDAPATELVEALVYRAELAVRLKNPERARALLAQVSSLDLGEEERATVGDALASAEDLREQLP